MIMYPFIRKHSSIIYIYIVHIILAVFSPFLFGYISWLDETIICVLGLYILKYNKTFRKKECLIILFSLIFFLIYSLNKKVNIYNAALLDFFIFFKPFISFYVPFLLCPQIDIKIRKRLKTFFLIVGFYCWGLLPFMNNLFSNPSKYYPICILTAMSYLYFSNKNRKDWIVALFILIPGLYTLKSKFIVEFLSFIFIAFYVKEKINISLKWILSFVILVIASIYLTWTKFSHYFINTEDEAARTLFYSYSYKNYIDYFPFGTGFGTYATEAAAKYYSPLYIEYGFDKVWGLSPDSYKTTHNYLNDTFYPILSQFGIIGTLLFLCFWIKRWYDAKRLEIQIYKQFLFVFTVIGIQCIAANSFTGPIGVPYMMMLGLLLSNINSESTRKTP